jgi:hypothetical protein
MVIRFQIGKDKFNLNVYGQFKVEKLLAFKIGEIFFTI